MKFTLTVAGIGIISFLLTSFGPWWLSIVPAAVSILFVHYEPGKAFLTGFLGVGLAWGVEAYVIDIQNQGIISERIGEMFNSAPVYALIAITFLIGGVLGGLGSATASAALKWIVAK